MRRAAASLVERAGADLLVSVRLTPRAAHDRIDGCETLADGRIVLKARVRAVPEAGKANDALLRLLATALDVPLRGLQVASGATARLKTVRIADAPAGLEDAVLRLAGASATG